MNGAKIKGGAGVGRGSRTPSPRTRRAPPRRQTKLDRLIALLPVSGETLSRVLTGVVVMLAAGVLWMTAQFFGLPAMAGQEMAALAARSGFQVAKVEVQGLKRMDEMPVYTLALDEIDRSMLSVDLAELRARVMTLGWVEDARVTRRLPNTLVINIVERDPVAVWQHGGKLSLIDVNGVELEKVDGRSMPDLPLVVGPQANRETKSLQNLMEAAPALKPLLAGATWVGNRRWDLRFQSGETLSLPEGGPSAAAALMKFAQLDGVNRLLGRGIVRFDMRDPERFVLRMPPDRRTATGEAGAKDAAPGATPKLDKGAEQDERSPRPAAARTMGSGEA
ncbi:cell division protein FtsQ/DivIB [Sphingobium sufflavum]|uniref:cell division protein FtsQ/DivIB n=1 Tax=Sphingobium sufflavum TaxID=1129547 RepID=UPI001F1A0CB6|nr:cell division protein FtsQ/DivIB [Sphingobium sufflavum]MCE7795881.1 cell division protein FtsQ/DivIB [Sphingobium sufflavum]